MVLSFWKNKYFHDYVYGLNLVLDAMYYTFKNDFLVVGSVNRITITDRADKSTINFLV